MGIKFKIYPSFYIFLFFVVYFNSFSFFFTYFISLFIHEYSHYILTKTYSITTKTINIHPFGMCLDVNSKSKNKTINLLVYLIGPISNILLFLVTISLWWAFPISYFYTRDFVMANFVLGFFNLIPLYPLDGGNLIMSCLSTATMRIKALKIMKKISLIVGCIFSFLFVVSCFYTINFSCFCIAFFMFSNLFSYKDFIDGEIKNRLCDNRVREQRAYVINLNTDYDSIKKCFDDNYYVQFYVINDENKIIKILSQDDVEKVFQKRFLE